MGGCGSSGTTLLVHLMSRNVEVGSGPEFNCFNHAELYDIDALRKAWPRLKCGRGAATGYIDVPVFMTHRQHYHITDDLVEYWLSRAVSASEFVQSIQLHLRETLNCRVVLEKSPSNVYTFLAARDSLPGVRLIHVIRDGRDVAVSLFRRGFNLFGAGSRWLYDTLCGLAARGQEDLLEVRYEALVRDPDEVVGKALRHIGALREQQRTLVDKAAERGLYSEDWKARSEPRAWNQTPDDPISDRSVGQYRSILCRKELARLYRIRVVDDISLSTGLPRTFGDLIEFLGYDRTDAPDSTPTDWVVDQQLMLADYYRRLRRFVDRGDWSFPRHYTTLD